MTKETCTTCLEQFEKNDQTIFAETLDGYVCPTCEKNKENYPYIFQVIIKRLNKLTDQVKKIAVSRPE